MSPLVSIVMPNYNGGRFLRDTIDSVLSQTYSEFEFIIVDDASTDDSLDVLKGYQIDSRIQIYKLEKNSQICIALNKGLDKAKGKYIARIDSDDCWMPEKLEKQVAYMESHPFCGVCFTWPDIIDEQNRIVNDKEQGLYELFQQKNRSQEEWIHKLYFDGNCLCHPSSLIRREALETAGVYDNAGLQLQDYELWMRILIEYPIHVLEENLTRYRRIQVNNNSISSASPVNQIREFNERALFLKGYLDKLPSELFYRSFRQDFVYQNSRSKQELNCEKAFIQLKLFEGAYGMEAYPLMAMEPFRELLNQEDTRELLEGRFHFTCKDYYVLTGRHIFNDYILQKSGSTISRKRMSFYYNTGSGYNNLEKTERLYSCTDGRISEVFHIPEELTGKCRKIRVDLLDGEACVFKNVRFWSDGCNLQVKPLNGFCHEEYWVFPTMDPQMEMEFDGDWSGNVQIEATVVICGLEELENWLGLIEKAGKDYKENMEDLKEALAIEAQEKEGLIEDLNREREEKIILIQKLHDAQDELAGIAETCAELEEKILKRQGKGRSR